MNHKRLFGSRERKARGLTEICRKEFRQSLINFRFISFLAQPFRDFFSAYFLTDLRFAVYKSAF